MNLSVSLMSLPPEISVSTPATNTTRQKARMVIRTSNQSNFITSTSHSPLWICIDNS